MFCKHFDFDKSDKMKRKISKRFKIFLIIPLITITVYFFIFMQSQKTLMDVRMFPLTHKVSLPYTVVHLDLKGAPPKLGYLESILPILSKLGVNGLLMEYEDMFPYEGRLVNLSAKNCYQKTKLKSFLSLAVESGFEIIPLVQTFGHMEFVLKLEEYTHLREVPHSSSSICPSKKESLELIKEMLKQVIDFHRKISPVEHIHVGCDEVFFLKKCEDCFRRADSIHDIIFQHIKNVGEMVIELSQDTVILVWDDMFRSLKPLKWTTLEKFKNIELVYWKYEPKVISSNIDLYQYHKKFPNIWIASAFKGADGKHAIVPNLIKRYTNNFSWLQNIFGYKFGGETEAYEFKGIILTGWSRYNHMEPMCELLPASMPSLILNLLLIKRFKTGLSTLPEFDNRLEFYSQYLLPDFAKTLNCTNMNSVSLENMDFLTCDFSGKELYDAVKCLDIINDKIVVNKRTFSQEYYSRVNSKNEVARKHAMDWYSFISEAMMRAEHDIITSMKKYYDNDVINEYVSSQTNETKKILKEFGSNFTM